MLHGFSVGLLAAILDISILVAGATPFIWLFAASNLGRLIAGILSGAVAQEHEK